MDNTLIGHPNVMCEIMLVPIIKKACKVVQFEFFDKFYHG